MNRWFRKFSLVAADGAGVFLDVHCQRCSHSYLVGARSFLTTLIPASCGLIQLRPYSPTSPFS